MADKNNGVDHGRGRYTDLRVRVDLVAQGVGLKTVQKAFDGQYSPCAEVLDFERKPTSRWVPRFEVARLIGMIPLIGDGLVREGRVSGKTVVRERQS